MLQRTNISNYGYTSTLACRMAWSPFRRSGDEVVGYILSTTDYDPFGMIMNGRDWNAGEYRFGFNGQEKDQEIYNNQSTTTATFWEYDGRIGRRWNLDPKPTVGVSEYSTFNNNPINYNDPLGDTVQISFRAGGFLGLKMNTVNYKNGSLFNRDGSDYNGKRSQFVKATVESLDKIGTFTEGENDLNELVNSKNVFNIIKTNGGNEFIANNVAKAQLATLLPAGITTFSGSGGTILFNPYSTKGGLNTQGTQNRPIFIGLGHELLGHALSANRGIANYSTINCNGITLLQDENFAMHQENKLRIAHFLPLRAYYGIDYNTNKGIYPALNNGYDYYGDLKLKTIKATYVK